MRKEEFRNWMLNQKRKYMGKVENYSEYAIESRISCLVKLEEIFKIDLDEKVENRAKGEEFLIDIRNAHIEDLAHTPLSNAFRHYFKFATGVYIYKIF